MNNYIIKNFIDCNSSELDEILKWRNSQDVRENSFNQNIISREAHFNYVKTLQNRSDVAYFLIYDENNIPLGVVSFTNITEKSAEVGYYKSLNRKNEKGVGKKLLNIATNIAKKIIKNSIGEELLSIVTKVFFSNTSSIKSIINAGYIERIDKRYNIVINDKEVLVYYYELQLNGEV